MKSYGRLWPQITAAENFALAWRRVRRRHASSEEVLEYERHLGENLEALRQELIAGAYRPGGFRQFKVWDPKPRIISCAPVRDRIIHHALCAVITPILERRFIDGSYACRKGKGSHLACLKARELALKSEATIVAPVSEGVPFLGLRIFAGSWRLKRGRFMRTRHTVAVKAAQWQEGIIDEGRFAASLAAADGAARWFGFKGILNNLGNQENKVTEEGASSGSNRVNRGGSWNNNANNCRSAYRNNNYNPSNYNNNLGFRLSSTLPPRPGSAGSHSARPALREGEDEQARPAAAGSAERRERCGLGLAGRLRSRGGLRR